ncbi:hypothetical protein GCM10027610_070690 [Dactylosporangium cerinum]
MPTDANPGQKHVTVAAPDNDWNAPGSGQHTIRKTKLPQLLEKYFRLVNPQLGDPPEPRPHMQECGSRPHAKRDGDVGDHAMPASASPSDGPSLSQVATSTRPGPCRT